MNRTGRWRSGVTLIQTLVVLAIIGLLFAIVLPAVQMVRGSSRQAQCTSRLKEIGVALSLYQSSHRCFPAAVLADKVNPFNGQAHAGTGYSAFSRLLPYLERSDVYGAVNFDFWPGRDNFLAKQIPVAAFKCPADGGKRQRERGTINYRVNLGTDGGTFHDGLGAFRKVHCLRPADFRKGLSHTVGVSERVTGGFDPDRYRPPRDYLLHADGDPRPDTALPMPAEVVLPVCRRQSRTPGQPFHPTAGVSWLGIGYQNTWYNHLATPNAEGADCDPVNGIGINVWFGSFAARSFHGVVNTLRMDGSLTGVSAAVDAAVWRKLGQRE